MAVTSLLSRAAAGAAWLALVLLPTLSHHVATATPPGASPEGESTAVALPAGRLELLELLAQQIRADELNSARSTAFHYLQLFPGNGTMTYNLACLEARLGRPAAAWQALDEAFQLGYSDLWQVQHDPDLASLRGGEEFPAWVEQRQAELRERALAAGFILREEYWSEERTLRPNDGTSGGNLWPQVSVKFRYRAESLGLSARIRASRFLDRPEPWRNGDGLLVNVVIPLDDGSYQSRRHFTFGFGLVDQQPVGAVAGKDGEPISQRVLELDPRISLLGSGEASYEIEIPWPSLAPYAPPVDSLLGVNVFYLSVGEDGIRRRVALVQDPHSESPRVPWRRFAPVTFGPSDRSRPVLRGRVNDRVVGAAPLEIELLAWATRTDPATWEVKIQDVSGRSVVSGGPVRLDQPVQVGLNRLTRTADLAALPSGPFDLLAQLTLPDGSQLTWQLALLRLRENWRESVVGRLGAVPALEQPSIHYRLDAVAEALARRHPREDPSPIFTTLGETGLMVTRAEKTGSVLPETGSTMIAYSDHEGMLRLCSLYLPAGFPPAGSPRYLVLMCDRRDSPAVLAGLLGQALADLPDLLVMVPHPRGPHRFRQDFVLRDAAAAIGWARDRFGTGPVLLAGIGEGAADAIHLTFQQPRLFERALVLAGEGFIPWPGRSHDQMVRLFATRPNDIHYTLAAAPGNPGQKDQRAALVAALAETGFRIATEVPAGPGPAADLPLDLVARWARETSPPAE